MRILRALGFLAERLMLRLGAATMLRDWAACRRYERLILEFQLGTRVKGSRLPAEFRTRRTELRKRRLQLELTRNLEQAATVDD